MKVREFTVSKQVIIPKQEFENVKVMESITYEIDETEDLDMVSVLAWDELNKLLKQEVDRVAKNIEISQHRTQEASPVTTTSDKSYCSLHKVQMKERTSQAGTTYFDHRRKNAGGSWERCFGSGWKGQ